MKKYGIMTVAGYVTIEADEASFGNGGILQFREVRRTPNPGPSGGSFVKERTIKAYSPSFWQHFEELPDSELGPRS